MNSKKIIKLIGDWFDGVWSAALMHKDVFLDGSDQIKADFLGNAPNPDFSDAIQAVDDDLANHTGNTAIHFLDAPENGTSYMRMDKTWTPNTVTNEAIFNIDGGTASTIGLPGVSIDGGGV